MKDCIELHFCAERPPRLRRTVLHHGSHATIVLDAELAPPGEPSFRPSRGLQALCLALLRLHLAPPGGERPELLAGGRGSAASTLDSLVHKADSLTWLRDVLRTPKGPSAGQRLHGWFERRNSQLNNADRPVQIYPRRGAGALAPGEVVVFLGARRGTAGEVRAIERALAQALGEVVAEGARVFGGLPATGEGLVGREAERLELHDALVGRAMRGVQIVAPGGTGKTALAARCLKDLSGDGGGPFARIVAWSFYRQGLSAEAALPMWQFRAAVASALGASVPEAASPQEIVDALLAALRREPTLLVLDGVEAVLHPSGEEAGRLRDDVLPGLLAGFAREAGGGAFLITTRLAVADLEEMDGVAVTHLGPLRREHTRTLLRELGVAGLPRDLDAAAAFSEGRPLLVRLLASRYRAEPRDPHTGLRGLLAELRDAARWTDGWSDEPSMARMLRSYARWFAGRPELVLLQLAALFDRLPADAAMHALLTGPGRLGGLLEDWRDLPTARWAEAAESLRGHGLAAADGDGFALELHPVIHGFFAAQLRTERPEAWRAGHLALYEYFRAKPDKELPDTLEEMEPLLRACYHGCRAGEYQRAFEEVGLPRVSRGVDAYLLTQLGAVHETRAMMSSFCSAEGRFPADSDLSPEARGLISTALSHCERLNERPRSALRLMRRGVASLGRASDPLLLAVTCVNVIRLCMVTGELRRGLLTCLRLNLLAKRNARIFATDPSTPLEKEVADYFASILAVFLLACGRRADGEAILAPSLARARRDDPEARLLGGLAAPFHASWLLETGQTGALAEAIDRGQADYDARRFEVNNAAALIRGRAWTQSALESDATADQSLVANAGAALDEAVHQARNFGRWLLVTEALLARARWRAHFGRPEDFQSDLNQGKELCRAHGYRLLEADLAVLEADYRLRHGQKLAAKASLRTAEGISRRCGYRLRQAEVARLRRALK